MSVWRVPIAYINAQVESGDIGLSVRMGCVRRSGSVASGTFYGEARQVPGEADDESKDHCSSSEFRSGHDEVG